MKFFAGILGIDIVLIEIIEKIESLGHLDTSNGVLHGKGYPNGKFIHSTLTH